MTGKKSTIRKWTLLVCLAALLVAAVPKKSLCDEWQGGWVHTEKAQNRGEPMTDEKDRPAVPFNPYAEQMSKKALQIEKYVQSPKFRARVKRWQDKIKKELGFTAPHSAKLQAKERESKTPDQKSKSSPFACLFKRGKRRHLYVFVSSSVPIETIRRYVKAAAGIRSVTFVLRGFVAGIEHGGATLSFIYDCLRLDANGNSVYNVEFYVDPLLFRRYKITSVPTFVYTDEEPLTDAFTEDLHVQQGKELNYCIISGDASPEYIAKRLASAECQRLFLNP